MSKTGIIHEQLPGSFRGTAFNARVSRAKGVKALAAVELKGGLGDPGSVSMEKIADDIVEASDGLVLAATVATIRKMSVWRAIRNNPEAARKHRSQSLKGSSDKINDKYHPDAHLFVGQSQGVVNVVDAVKYQLTHPKLNTESPRLGIVTMDGPAVYGPMEYEGSKARVFGGLVVHCARDIQKMPIGDRMDVTWQMLQSTSPFEFRYFMNESRYLGDDLDLSPDIAYLRANGVGVTHIWHRDDYVKGAERACDNSIVLDGGHLTFMHQRERIVEHIADRALQMLDLPQAA